MPEADDRDIRVEINLAGGYRHETFLPASSQVLHDLFAALATQHLGAGSPISLIQVPLNGGRVACSFAASNLVSVITDPPVVIELPSRPETQPVPLPTRPLHVEIENFLPAEENAELLQYAIENRDRYKPGSVTSNEPGYRKSEVLFEVAASKWKEIFASRLRLLMPHVIRTLAVAEFTPGDFEIQLTASNDGAYFKPHADSGDYATNFRHVTFVYYLHRMPKPFLGGNLAIYATEQSAVPAYSIEPRNNTLVMFRSPLRHEVEPVHCPTHAFADGRFTVNGWFRSKAPDFPALPLRRQGVIEGRVVDDMRLEFPGNQGVWLGPAGQTAWQLCDGTRSLAAIEAAVEGRYPARGNEAASEAVAALRQLHDYGFFEL
jgi:SM-20-related protein